MTYRNIIRLAAAGMVFCACQSDSYRIKGCASHCVMSGPASDRVQESALEEIVFTDSNPYTQRCAKVKQLSVADMFAEAIRRVIDNKSISDLYIV